MNIQQFEFHHDGKFTQAWRSEIDREMGRWLEEQGWERLFHTGESAEHPLASFAVQLWRHPKGRFLALVEIGNGETETLEILIPSRLDLLFWVRDWLKPLLEIQGIDMTQVLRVEKDALDRKYPPGVYFTVREKKGDGE